MKQFESDTEMLLALDDFMYKTKGLPKSDLRNSLVKHIIQFLSDNGLDRDQHNFVDCASWSRDFSIQEPR